MELDLDLGQWFVIGVCSLLILGYIYGYFYNRQKAAQILSWLHQGLKDWGPINIAGKLPGMASGGRLEVLRASPPLRQIEAVYLLAPRENLLFWLFYRLQGRQDELFLWLTFQSKPQQSVEAARPGDRQFSARLKSEKPALQRLESIGGLQIAVEAPVDSALVTALQAFIQRHPHSLVRLSLRPNKPHLFIRMRLGAVQTQPAAELLKELSSFNRSNQSEALESRP